MHYRRCFAACFVASLFLGSFDASAQNYPTKNIRIVVTQGAGGMADMIGRFLANGISQASGQTAVVENCAGGGAMIGSDVVAKSNPDGHNLLAGTVSLAILPAIDGSLPFRNRPRACEPNRRSAKRAVSA